MTARMTRREFFSGAAALIASTSVPSYAAHVGAGCPHLKFGVLSDLHISPERLMQPYLKGDASLFRPRETDLFERALAYFDERGADAVVLAGDLADWGLVCQMKALTDCWWRHFPSGCSKLDGRRVELLAILGNHDVAFRAWTSQNYATKVMGSSPIPPEEIFRNDVPRHWQELFHEPYTPLWQKTVKGYTFIGAHWQNERGNDAIEPYLAAHADELKGTRPFFFIQHPHPRGTCFGSWVPGQDDGRSTEALSAFPNAVAFSGHAHRPLTEEQNVWQGAFTSIGTATLHSLVLGRGRENGVWRPKTNRRQAMKAMRGFDAITGDTIAAHGQFVCVYDGFIEIERREFVTGRSLGDNWVIPVPAGEKAPFRFDVREQKETAPGPFPEGAVVTVDRVEDNVRLTFPPARTVSGASRALEYEVTATVEVMDVTRILFRRYVYSPSAFGPAADDICPVCALFRHDLFPEEGVVRFSVRARSQFGHLNAPICGLLETECSPSRCR